MKNCPNCGAPIDTSRKTCAYCDTPYTKEVDTFNIDYNQYIHLIEKRTELLEESMRVDRLYAEALSALNKYSRRYI